MNTIWGNGSAPPLARRYPAREWRGDEPAGPEWDALWVDLAHYVTEAQPPRYDERAGKLTARLAFLTLAVCSVITGAGVVRLILWLSGLVR